MSTQGVILSIITIFYMVDTQILIAKQNPTFSISLFQRCKNVTKIGSKDISQSIDSVYPQTSSRFQIQAFKISKPLLIYIF